MNKQVEAIIKNIVDWGTAMDHLYPERLPRTTQLIEIDYGKIQETEGWVRMGTVNSKQYGIKGIIKVPKLYLSKENKKKVLAINPRASISDIKSGRVINKIVFGDVFHSDTIERFIKCYKDPHCASNKDRKATPTMFFKNDEVYVCKWCDKEYSPLEIKFFE